MKSDDLSSILDDIVASVGEILVIHSELNESMIDDAATDEAKKKIERLKAKTLDAKKRLSDLKDRQRHKREVERERREHERSATNEGKTSGMVTLRAASGRVIGFMRVMGPNRTDFFAASGRLVAREVGDITYANGKAAYRGRLGLVALGASFH